MTVKTPTKMDTPVSGSVIESAGLGPVTSASDESPLVMAHRREIGLTKPGMEFALESHRQATHIVDEDQLSASLVEAYRHWKADVLATAHRKGRMTTRDVSKLLDLSEYYVFMLRWRGFLNCSTRIGRRYLFTPADIEALFEHNENRVWLAEMGELDERIAREGDGEDEKAQRMNKTEREKLKGNKLRRGPLGHAFLRSLGYDDQTLIGREETTQLTSVA